MWEGSLGLERRIGITGAVGVVVSTVGMIGVLIPLAIAGGSAWYAVPIVVLAGLGGIGISFTMSRQLARRLAEPIDHMSKVATRFRKEGGGISVATRGFKGTGSEVGKLLHDFEEMVLVFRRRDLEQDMEIRELRTQLETAEEELRATTVAEGTKEDSLARMGDELQAPLQSIAALADVLASDAEDAELFQYLDDLHSIGDAARGLLWKLQGVAALSALRAGRFVLDSDVLDVAQLVEQIVEAHEQTARRNNTTLAVEVPESIGAIRGDRKVLFQILFNLVGNSAKVVRGGRIVVRAERHVHSMDLFVVDEGVVLTERQVEQLFEPFSLLETETPVEGSGLGVALCKEYVDLMGGTIGVVAQPGRGMVVTITLPIDRSGPGVSGAGDGGGGVFDDPTMRYL